MDANNIIYTIKLFDQLLVTLIHEQSKIKKNYQQDRIKTFIERRNDDFKNNQRRMLNSILERTPMQIKLDRVKTIIDNQIHFTTDAYEIERITNDHFRSVGTETPSNNPFTSYERLSDFWKDIYTPDAHKIDSAKLYFQSAITYDEIISVKNDIPLHKAPGPNRISYDIIKKLPNSFFLQLVPFFNHIIEYNEIPSA